MFFYYRSTEELPCTPPSELQKEIYATLVSRIKEPPLKGMIGPDYVTGSNLPSHSNVHISCLTGLRIQVLVNITRLFAKFGLVLRLNSDVAGFCIPGLKLLISTGHHAHYQYKDDCYSSEFFTASQLLRFF